MSIKLLLLVAFFGTVFSRFSSADECNAPPQCESAAQAVEAKYFGSSAGFKLEQVFCMGPSRVYPRSRYYQTEVYFQPDIGGGGHEVELAYGYRGNCRLVRIDLNGSAWNPIRKGFPLSDNN